MTNTHSLRVLLYYFAIQVIAFTSVVEGATDTVELRYYYSRNFQFIEISGKRATVASLPIFPENVKAFFRVSQLNGKYNTEKYQVTLRHVAGGYYEWSVGVKPSGNKTDFTLMRINHYDTLSNNGWVPTGYAVTEDNLATLQMRERWQKN